MLRKQVYIEERQERLLKKVSRKLHVPEAELIRRGIDYSITTSLVQKADTNLWLDEKKFISRLKKKPTQKAVSWTREELHER